MGGNKDNMRQAMKELLGLVGFGPEDEEGGESTAAEARATRTATRTVERPVEQPRRERVVEEPAAEQRTSARPSRGAEQLFLLWRTQGEGTYLYPC